MKGSGSGGPPKGQGEKETNTLGSQRQGSKDSRGSSQVLPEKGRSRKFTGHTRKRQYLKSSPAASEKGRSGEEVAAGRGKRALRKQEVLEVLE